jgi:alkylation response protein AidB-like acyl-CoA dehydrogenase
VLDDVRALPENVIGEVGGFPLAVLGFARQLTIVEGTSQVRLWLIARGVLDHDLRWD